MTSTRDSVHVLTMQCIPIGEENAKSARGIYRDVGCWADTTVRQTLISLAKRGIIKRKQVPVRGRGNNDFTYRYWRVSAQEVWDAGMVLAEAVKFEDPDAYYPADPVEEARDRDEPERDDEDEAPSPHSIYCKKTGKEIARYMFNGRPCLCTDGKCLDEVTHGES